MTMAESIRGNKTLSGTWGELWIDGEKIFEFSKIELKVTANREDVQIGIDILQPWSRKTAIKIC